MVFCNYTHNKDLNMDIASHNPYFNRWFSAITKQFEKETEDAVSQSLF